jgi:hypothetical protein
LLAGLATHGTHGTPTEVAYARIELRDASAAVTILVMPEQWEQVVAKHAGNDIAMYLDELLAPRQDDERFVVFFDGDLARSTREKLPPVRGQAIARRLADHRAAHPSAEVGWFAHTPPTPRTSSGQPDAPMA